MLSASCPLYDVRPKTSQKRPARRRLATGDRRQATPLLRSLGLDCEVRTPTATFALPLLPAPVSLPPLLQTLNPKFTTLLRLFERQRLPGELSKRPRITGWRASASERP
nr:hypothetical protein Iba_chr05dCG17410 [Ipomoea batatas]